MLQVRLDQSNPGSVPVFEMPANGGAMPVNVVTNNPGAVPVRVSSLTGSMPVRVMSGTLSTGPDVTALTAESFQDFRDASIAVVSVATAQSSDPSDVVTWSNPLGAYADLTVVAGDDVELPDPIICNGAERTSTGTKWLQIEHGTGNADERLLVAHDDGSGGPYADGVVKFFFKTTANATGAEISLDLLQMEGGPFATFQWNDPGTARLRAHSDDGGTTFSTGINITSGHLYYVAFRRDKTNGRVRTTIFDAENSFAIVGSFSCTMEASVNQTFEYFIQSGYFEGAGDTTGVSQFGGISFHLSDPDDSVSGATLAAPSGLSASQTAVGTLVLTGTTLTDRNLIERTSNGGSSWGTVATNVPLPYTDATCADGATYSYRATANAVGVTSSVSSASAGVTVNDGPYLSSEWLVGSPASGTPRGGAYWVGCQFAVGASNVDVTSLGRWRKSGDTGNRTLRVIRNSNSSVVGEVVVDMSSGTLNAVKYAAETFTLLAGETYTILSDETAELNTWFDEQVLDVDDTIATINYAVYSNDGVSLNASTIGMMYVGLSFQFTP